MRVYIYSFYLISLFVFFSCHGKIREEKAHEENIVNDTLLLLEPDSSKVFYRDELYANADNSFYDFIYLFKSDSVFQSRRISFPVVFEDKNGMSEISYENWHFDSLLLSNIYYTQFYSSEKDIDEQQETDMKQVSLRELYLKNGQIKSYHFRKNGSLWMLYGVERSDAGNDDFRSFFAKFISDSVFQNEHLARKLKFVTYDPEDEFSVIESDLSSEQWNAFKPMIQTDIISEFDYHNCDSGSDVKIASVVQIDTGYNIRFHFIKNWRKGWLLYKYEDLSN